MNKSFPVDLMVVKTFKRKSRKLLESLYFTEQCFIILFEFHGAI